MTTRAKVVEKVVHVEPLTIHWNSRDQKVYVRMKDGSYSPIETHKLEMLSKQWNEYENLRELHDLMEEIQRIKSSLLIWGCFIAAAIMSLAVSVLLK